MPDKQSEKNGKFDTGLIRELAAILREANLGEIEVEGLQRYDASTVRRLATFGRGTPYNEKLLLDYQERLLKLGLLCAQLRAALVQAARRLRQAGHGGQQLRHADLAGGRRHGGHRGRLCQVERVGRAAVDVRHRGGADQSAPGGLHAHRVGVGGEDRLAERGGQRIGQDRVVFGEQQFHRAKLNGLTKI